MASGAQIEFRDSPTAAREKKGLSKHFLGGLDLFRWIARHAQIRNDQLEAFRNATKSDAKASGKKPLRVFYVMRRPSFVRRHIWKEICRLHGFTKPRGEFLAERTPADYHISGEVLSLRGYSGLELSVTYAQKYRQRLSNQLDLLLRQESHDVFVPVSIFPGKGPRPIPGPMKLGVDFPYVPIADLWFLFVSVWHRGDLFLQIGPPIQAKPMEQGTRLLNRLSRSLYHMEKTARGARIQPTVTIQNIICSGDIFEEQLLDIAGRTGLSRDRLFARAGKLFREIAATMKGRAISVLNSLITPFIRKVFSHIDVRGLDELGKHVGNKPIILLPSHRSHFDYLILSFILYHGGLPLPYVAAGENLNFFPVGGLLKSAGAFFIRRRIDNDALYKIVLERYLTYLVKQGHLIEFYLEGGRSRTGLMLRPRLGLLKYLLRSVNTKARGEVFVFPVAISYESVPEERSIVAELQGQKKQRESFLQLLRFSRLFKKQFGSVTVSFLPPLPLKSNEEDDEKDRLSAKTEDFGFVVSRDIISGFSLTQSALSAATLLSVLQDSCSTEELQQNAVRLFVAACVARGVDDAPRWIDRDPVVTAVLLDDIESKLTISVNLKQTLLEKSLTESMADVLKSVKNSSGELIVAGETFARPTDGDIVSRLEYYKNHFLHIIAPAALTGCVLLAAQKDFDSVLHRVHQLFKPLLLLPRYLSWRVEAEKMIKVFEMNGWARAHKLTTKGKRALFPSIALLAPFLDRFHATLEELLLLDTQSVSENEFLTRIRIRLRDPKRYAPPLKEAENTLLLKQAIEFLGQLRAVAIGSVAYGGKERERHITRRKDVTTSSDLPFDSPVEARDFLATLRSSISRAAAKES